jgi:DNA-3-methyladenine glycosylase
VLIRAILPSEGLVRIAANRHHRPPAEWTNGPAKLCQALAIDGSFNGTDLTNPAGGLWIEPGISIKAEWITAGPRVGIDYAGEPWISMPWRYRALMPEGLPELTESEY